MRPLIYPPKVPLSTVSIVVGDDATPNSENVTRILRAEVTVNGQTRLHFPPRAHGVASRQARTRLLQSQSPSNFPCIFQAFFWAVLRSGSPNWLTMAVFSDRRQEGAGTYLLLRGIVGSLSVSCFRLARKKIFY